MPSKHIEIANGTFVNANQVGEFDVNLKDALYVHKLNVNLISVAAIQPNGYSVLFSRNVCKIQRDHDGACVLSTSRAGRSYEVAFTPRGLTDNFQKQYVAQSTWESMAQSC